MQSCLVIVHGYLGFSFVGHILTHLPKLYDELYHTCSFTEHWCNRSSLLVWVMLGSLPLPSSKPTIRKFKKNPNKVTYFSVLFTFATEAGWEVMFSPLCLSVCLSVCEQDISKSCGRIWRKLGRQVGYVTRKN